MHTLHFVSWQLGGLFIVNSWNCCRRHSVSIAIWSGLAPYTKWYTTQRPGRIQNILLGTCERVRVTNMRSRKVQTPLGRCRGTLPGKIWNGASKTETLKWYSCKRGLVGIYPHRLYIRSCQHLRLCVSAELQCFHHSLRAFTIPWRLLFSVCWLCKDPRSRNGRLENHSRKLVLQRRIEKLASDAGPLGLE